MKQKTDNVQKLIKAYDEYIDLIEDEIVELEPNNHVSIRHKKCKKARAKIERLKNKVGE